MSPRKEQPTAASEPWTDDAPAIGCPRDFRITGEGEQYVMRLVGVPLEFEFDRPRQDHGELIGLLTVRTDLSGARTYDRVLSTGTQNLSSPTARKTRAKQLTDLLRAPQIDIERLLEEFAIRVLAAERNGGGAIDLREIPRAVATDSLDIYGIRILDKHPIFVFGDGGTGKSLIGLFLGGTVARQGLKVGYADWELSGEDHRDRYERLFGPDMPPLLYIRCSRPMTAEADRIRRLVRQHSLDYLICDSVAFASDGRPEDAEVAARYFQCLRQIGVGSLNIAHTNKSDESDKKPFGSAFWHNGARSTWNVKLSDGTTLDRNQIAVGLYHRKSNLGPLLPAVGLRISFGDERTAIERVDLATVDDLSAGLPLRQRIQQAVKHGPQTLASLGEELGARTDSIDRIVRRYDKPDKQGRNHIFTRIAGNDGISRIALVERRAS